MPKTVILKPYIPLYALNGKEIMAQKKLVIHIRHIRSYKF